MKKLMLILVVVFESCKTPVSDPVVLTFEEAVQEVYEMTGRTLFYSSNGINMNNGVGNRVSSPNEIPGVCTDYAIEFAYYWNEVKDYDEVYGKAYFICIWPGSSTLYIIDGNFVGNGTSHIRENSGNFMNNANLQEMDGVWRDVIVTSILFTTNNFSHFGKYVNNHMWIIIKIGNDWYDTEPTWWDISLDNNVPYKLSL